jgi:phosphomannomutase/phosphoglucomutase
VPENLTDLIALVKKEKLDIGIAFDGDGDRMIAVDNNGKLLWPDRIMILLAQDVLKTHPSARIVFDVKCSYLLPKAINDAGGQASMCVSGHSILKMQMKRLNASMGGEFSGHIVMPDRWNDFDDGPYVASRLLEILSNTTESSSEVFSKIPDSVSTPEYKLHVDNHDVANDLVEAFIKNADFSGANLTLIDGLRVDYGDGWGLVRSSNTSACLGFRFEAISETRLDEIKEQFHHVFQKLNHKQPLPF